MDYEQFITEMQKYWGLREKGLKKQANGFLFSFTKYFKENVADADADAIMFQFCREYLDEMKFPGRFSDFTEIRTEQRMMQKHYRFITINNTVIISIIAMPQPLKLRKYIPHPM